MSDKKHFHISGGKGFAIRFDNDYVVSVQFGPGNYCEHYDRRIGEDDVACGKAGSVDAECAVFGPGDQGLVTPPMFEHEVKGWMSPEEMLELLNWAAAQESSGEDNDAS